jgi:hypothetical protein
MKTPRANKLKKNRSQSNFTACKKAPILLKTKIGTIAGLFRQGRSFKFISLFERRSFSIHSQAGDFLLRWFAGSHDPIRCGVEVTEPLDAALISFRK